MQNDPRCQRCGTRLKTERVRSIGYENVLAGLVATKDEFELGDITFTDLGTGQRAYWSGPKPVWREEVSDCPRCHGAY